MSSKDNIVEKIYSFLEQVNPKSNYDDNSQIILLKKHHSELTIDNLTVDYVCGFEILRRTY